MWFRDLPKEALDSEQMRLLQTILETWRERNSVDAADPKVKAKARDLVRWFQVGIRDEERLLGLIEGR